MHTYFHVLGIEIPSYGTMIVLGAIIANLFAFFISKRDERSLDDLILLEAYTALGGFVKTKMLYVIVSIRTIEFHRLYDLEYLNSLINGGFVFYGGIFGGFIAIILAKKIHHIDLQYYSENYTFLIPLCHGFGRIGCFFAGCCYGMHYDGPFSVVFPHNSFAEPGVPLFPVQLVEAIGLFVISIVLFLLSKKKHAKFSVELYILLYGNLRFLLEFLRADEARGIVKGLSTSQWLSIFLVMCSLMSFAIRNKHVSKHIDNLDRMTDDSKRI